jgi:hypothetical protein
MKKRKMQNHQRRPIVNARHLLIAITFPLISGCASFGNLFGGSDVKPIEIKTKAVERQTLNIKEPAPLQAREVQWIVITPENAEQVWKDLKEKNVDVVLIGLTDEGYEQLALTMAELKNYIAQQRSIIIKYKEYYEPKGN